MGIKKELHAYQTFRRKHIVSLKKILKELPQLSKYFSFFNEIETKFWTKVAWKAKKKECQCKSHLIYSHARSSSKFCMFILCEIWSHELCSLIINVCKPPKTFDILETEQLFRFLWFADFPWVCYCRWEDRTHYLPCDFFDHKNEGKSLQNTIPKTVNSSKNIKKTSKCSSWNTQKERNIIS